MKRRLAMKTMCGGVAAGVAALFGRPAKSSPSNSPAKGGDGRVRWEYGTNLYRAETAEDAYIHGGGRYIILRLRGVDTEVSFPICNGLVNTYIKQKIVSRVIYHDLNSQEEREHALDHLTGLRLQLGLTACESKVYAQLLDVLAGTRGVSPLACNRAVKVTKG
jgi:hypothetical protein